MLKYPVEESNLFLKLRRLVCFRHTHGTYLATGIPYPDYRFTGGVLQPAINSVTWMLDDSGSTLYRSRTCFARLEVKLPPGGQGINEALGPIYLRKLTGFLQ